MSTTKYTLIYIQTRREIEREKVVHVKNPIDSVMLCPTNNACRKTVALSFSARHCLNQLSGCRFTAA